MKPSNSHIWQQHGLLPAGEALADKAMPHLLRALEELPEELANIVFKEALFQAYEIKTRTLKFQQKFKWRGR